VKGNMELNTVKTRDTLCEANTGCLLRKHT